ncbi:MAG: Gmad2 immunoglobulin-like domain-containing protein [Candidatus Pacebacteria bacterium]|nr:Gmad2 immunoglobulin-like domain-containing protein [Candidatus Paceibacterota bacterium]
MKKIVIVLALIITFIVIFVLGQKTYNKEDSSINSFEDCVAAGYLVLESYPRQCKTPDNQTFIEDIGNELEKIDLIRINNPRPNEIVKSPLVIQGEARGLWFFEADFPIKIFDANNNLLGFTIAVAQEDWMSEDFVPFLAEIEFEKPLTKKGFLVLEKDNPSGLAENEDHLLVPIIFE